MERLGQVLREAEHRGPTRTEKGRTIAAPVAGWVDVDIAGAVLPCKVPGSFRTNLAAGQDVMVGLTEGGVRTVLTIESALPAPTVAAPPSASAIAPGVNSTTSSGCYDASSGDAFSYARDVAATTRSLAGDINEIRNDVGGNASDLAALKTTVNNLRTTVAAMRTALLAQGHVT